MPERIQQRRTKGWRKPENTVSVARPGPWGNPWRVGDSALIEWPYVAPADGVVQVREVPITAALAVELYRIAIAPSTDEVRAELAGKNLMCFCPLDQPCHADVLLELANGTPE